MTLVVRDFARAGVRRRWRTQVPVVVSPADHAYFDVPDAEAWSDPRAGGWSEHRDRLAAHVRLWEQDELTYFLSSGGAGEGASADEHNEMV